VQVGWHIWHNHSFSPFYRAHTNLRSIARYSDYVKITVYHNAMTETVDGLYRSAFSPDYVYRETRRAVQAVAETDTQVLAGIDIDIPSHDTPPEASFTTCTPENTRENVLAAYRGGADGLLISRKYSEMRLANLSAVGETLRELRCLD
jgi:hypothetical protein